MFRYIYYVISLVIYILAIPYLIVKSKKSKYILAIPAKFFLRDNPKHKSNKIWFHCCSMGEVNALTPIVDKLNKDDINLTVMTDTGFAEGKKMGLDTRYLPFEIFLPFWITKQKILLVMEAELWYMMFLTAFNNGTKTILINARINDKSYSKYLKYKFFYKRLFGYVDQIFAQSQEDKKRLEELGGRNIEVIGNIKLSKQIITTKQLRKPSSIMITAGSTHESEEELILDAWDRSFGRLVIVPRHPQRFDDVDVLIRQYIGKQNISYHRYSQNKTFDSDIVLVDCLGELNNIYAISDVVVLGGGFIKTAGGHNPIEPAYFGCKLISGKNIFNQKVLFDCIKNAYLVNNEELKAKFENINILEKSKLDAVGDISPIIDLIVKNS